MPELQRRDVYPSDLFALRYVHEARLSPDGSRIARVTSKTLVSSAEELLEITLEELSSGARRDVRFDGRALFPRWSPDGLRVAFLGIKGASQRLYVTSSEGSECSALTGEGVRVHGAPSWSPDGRFIAYTVVNNRTFQEVSRFTQRVFRAEGLGLISGLEMGIHVVAVETRATNAVNVSRTIATQPSFSPCGRRLLFLGTNAALAYPSYGGMSLFTVNLADNRVAEVLGSGWCIGAAAWSPCGERLVVTGDYQSSLTVPVMGLWTVNVDGSDLSCRTKGLVGNIGLRVHHDMPTWDTSRQCVFSVPDSAYAYATVQKSGCAEIWRISLKGEVCYERVAFGPRSCLIMDASARSARLLYSVTDLNSPWELYLQDLTTGKEKQLTSLNRLVLAQWPALKFEHLEFESPDGIALEGWTLMRTDRSGPQPTIIFIHGGPFLTTGHAFRFDFHLLAANGYSVLFSNFRGSAGYGEPFARAIMGDWGARGFTDHMAAVDATVMRGLADPERLGVWGASHGGFATCWMVTHTNRFRAAVAESSFTNLSTWYYLADSSDFLVHDLGGRPDEIPDVYRSRSPLTYAGRCRTPTLLLHGSEDLRCPVSEAEQFYRALHDSNCKTEMVVIPGMNHMGDSTGPLPARQAQNEALLDWFERHF